MPPLRLRTRAAIFGAAVVVVGALSVHAWADEPSPNAAVPVVRPTVLAMIPHDANAATEGFEVDGNTLYEATGPCACSLDAFLAGAGTASELREVDPDTGAVRRSVQLPSNYWAEGITVVGDRIWQLVYEKDVAIEWDKATLTRLREIPITDQGWGLCLDGDRLIRSDGTGRLFFHTIPDFVETGSVTVTRDDLEVTGLDELECVDGQVWANLWPSDQFARIDPASGKVDLVADMSDLWRFGDRDKTQVLSGIAHLTGEDFLVDGKDWPAMFRVRIDAA